MKKAFLVLAITFMAATHVACNASSPLDVARYIAQKGWSSVKTKVPVLPVSDIAPAIYMKKGDSAPSCGLLAQATTGIAFLEILIPEPGGGFPQCLGISDVAAFDMNNRKYLVFEYLNRDTREEFYRQYFYVFKDAAGDYKADADLNDSAAWPDPIAAKSASILTPRAQEGIRRARGAMLSKAVPGMSFLGRDFITTKSSSFAIFQDKSREKCAFVVDAGAKLAVFHHESFSAGQKCTEVMASSSFEKNGKIYYLALYAGNEKNILSVVSVSENNLVAAEPKLAIAATQKGKLMNMIEAKKALLLALGAPQAVRPH